MDFWTYLGNWVSQTGSTNAKYTNFRLIYKPTLLFLVDKNPEFYQQKSLQPNTSANLIVIADVTLYMTFIEEGSYTHELH